MCEWKAIRWSCHAATTIVVDDPSVVTGKRVIADCEDEETARHIVACVKACDGIPTSRLEAGAADILVYSMELKKQRDELLEALENIACSYPETDEGEWMQSVAQDAITKAKGAA